LRGGGLAGATRWRGLRGARPREYNESCESWGGCSGDGARPLGSGRFSALRNDGSAESLRGLGAEGEPGSEKPYPEGGGEEGEAGELTGPEAERVREAGRRAAVARVAAEVSSKISRGGEGPSRLNKDVARANLSPEGERPTAWQMSLSSSFEKKVHAARSEEEGEGRVSAAGAGGKMLREGAKGAGGGGGRWGGRGAGEKILARSEV
jgi:hypothetical protein